MAKKQLTAILWRRVLEATVDTLAGRSKGQYDIRLGRSERVLEFFEGLVQEDATDLGGFSLNVPIEAFEGANPVDKQTIQIRYMGEASKRRDWNTPSQRPTTAYPLWREGRGLPSGHVYDSSDNQYVILAKDSENKFHARWLSTSEFSLLPEDFKSILGSSDFGVHFWPNKFQGLTHDITGLLKRKINVLIYGPPGTGKTYLMQEVCGAFVSPVVSIDTEKETDIFSYEYIENIKVGWVTFHQSYSYEEFIVGLRPDPFSEKLLSLVPTPGILLELAEFARKPEHTALLVIDEINRGNVSRIFGEFITLMEPDKRLSEDGKRSPTTVEIRLPYIKPGLQVKVEVDGAEVEVPNPFTMPFRFYTLASMNSVDKTIAPLDAALRRRFHTFNLNPSMETIRKKLNIRNDFDPEGLELAFPINDITSVREFAIALVVALNKAISFFRGVEYSLGQWYLVELCEDFETVDEAKEALTDIWKYKILPQLEELFHGRIEQLRSILRLDEFAKGDKTPLFLQNPSDAMIEVGAAPFLEQREVGNDEIIAFLRHLSGVREKAPPVEETSPDGTNVGDETIGGTPATGADDDEQGDSISPKAEN